MKRLILGLFAAVFTFSLVSCGQPQKPEKQKPHDSAKHERHERRW